MTAETGEGGEGRGKRERERKEQAKYMCTSSLGGMFGVSREVSLFPLAGGRGRDRGRFLRTVTFVGSLDGGLICDLSLSLTRG